ncbi:MAG: hypothetical protein AB1646_03700 [Thermodesulfobacteriota bacterium]
MRNTVTIVAIMCAVAVMMVGCGADRIPDSPISGSGAARAELIDLDKVLKIMADTIKELEPKKAADSTGPKTDAAIDKQETPKAPTARDTIKELEPKKAADSTGPKTDTATEKQETPKTPTAQNKIKEKEFVTKFAENLNQAAVYSKPIGVAMLQNGTVQGFEDPNKNNTKDGSDEKELFKVQFDDKQKRLVASDRNGYHRDHSFGMGMGGFFMGYLLASMMNRHQAAGLNPNRFDNTKMSQPGYHKAATTQARTPRTGGTSGKSGTARSRGGSGGFSRGGK